VTGTTVLVPGTVGLRHTFKHYNQKVHRFFGKNGQLQVLIVGKDFQKLL